MIQPVMCNFYRSIARKIRRREDRGQVEKQAESGKLSLADLNNLAGKGREISTGVLVLI